MKSYFWRNFVLIVCCIIAPFIIFITPLSPWFNKTTYDEYTAIYYVLSVGTFLIGLIAYIQLRNLIITLEVDYLLKIDKHLRSSEIIKTRIIIHDLYLKSQNELIKQGINEKHKEWESKLHKQIGNKIKELSISEDDKDKFIYLLNFLDFMETVGYLYTNKHITLNKLDKLFGASLIFNFRIFEPYILHRQKKHKIGDFYKEFKQLYLDLKKQNKETRKKKLKDHKCS